MTGSCSPTLPVQEGGKKRKRKPGFSQGQPRAIPCKLCVEKQLRTFEKDGWKASCCDQATEANNSTACFQCRTAKKPCEALDDSEPAVHKWGSIQRNPENHSKEEALDPAVDMKLYLLQSSVSISAVQESHYQTIAALADSTSQARTRLEGLFLKKCGNLDELTKDKYPERPGRQTALSEADRDKLGRLSDCSRLDDALCMAGDIVRAASREVNACQADIEDTLRNSEREP
ncbi:hypothetical protein F5883DRAFT_653371 [Diaporthe sp. PMI_573]|nr:hypothetical protein F5883DRAFT_653371 [Diaporthaceae sp. PMI_573]